MTASIGEYRLARQGGGRGAYAHVKVLVDEGNGGDQQVVWAVSPEDGGSAQPHTDPAEVDAARTGVLRALAALGEAGVDTTDRVVRLVHVGINIVDTEPGAVQAAAGMATAGAFGVSDRFEIVYEDGWIWRIRQD